MGNVHFVKHARKKNPVADIGESYYYWSFPFGRRKYYSKEYPTQEQLLESGLEHERVLRDE